MPKDFNSRWYLNTPKDDDDSPIAEAGRVVLNSTKAIKAEIQAAKAKAAANEDLSDKGRARAVAKEALTAMTRYRAAQARIGRELADHRMKMNKKTFERLPEVDVQSKFEIARWLREMPLQDRNAILRDAAAGRMPGGHEVLAAAFASFPRLLGYTNDDPTFNTIRDQYLSTSNPSAAAELLDIEVAENALAHAGDELEQWVEDVAPGFRSALNAEEGRTDHSELTVAEKSAAIEDGMSIGDLMKNGLIVDRDPPAESWDSSLPLAAKVAKVEAAA